MRGGCEGWRDLDFLKVFAERQSLALVRGANVNPVNLVGPGEKRNVLKTGHHLVVLDQKWNFMRPHFKNCPRAPDIVGAVSESRIKEACVMNTELADFLVDGNHFSRPIRWNADSFL